MDRMSYDKEKTSPELSGGGVRYSPSREGGHSGSADGAARTQQHKYSASTMPRRPASSSDTGAASVRTASSSSAYRPSAERSSAERASTARQSTTRTASRSSGVRTGAASSNAALSHRKASGSRLSMPLKIARISFAALLVLLIGAFVLFLLNQEPPKENIEAYIDDGTFFNGITINGRNVGGLTYAEARDTLIEDVNSTLRSVNMTIKHGTVMYILNANDLGMTSSLDAALVDAISLGRGGSVLTNADAKSKLEAEGKNYTIDYTIDPDKTLAALTKVGEAINTAPVEPTLEPDSWAAEPSFTVSGGKDGYVFNAQSVLEKLSASIAAGVFVDTLEPDLELVSPTLSSDALLANVKQRSIFQTSFGGSRAAKNEKRVGNIQKATTMLNGARIENGEEFNFNAFIGPRTEEGGWPLAPGIGSGERYEDQAGGGICQVSTTLYNALLCSGPEIEITERRHHSWPSSYADKGLDSTVTGTVESGKSLNFINNTGSPLYIFAYCNTDDYTMTVYIYGVPLPDGVTYQVHGVVDEEIQPGEPETVENPNWPTGYSEKTVTARTGYKATAYRDKLVNGEVVETEKLYTDTYKAVTEKTTIGTGSASLPKPNA